MIIGLAFLTIQHLDFTPVPQDIVAEQSESTQNDAASMAAQQQADITVLGSERIQAELSATESSGQRNNRTNQSVQDSLYLSQFGAQ